MGSPSSSRCRSCTSPRRCTWRVARDRARRTATTAPVHALARIMLHGRIDHIQTSWVKLGVERTQVMLNGGANDLGGTLMEETISRMAGSENGSAKSVEELVAIAEGIGRPARQRTTTYAPMAA